MAARKGQHGKRRRAKPQPQAAALALLPKALRDVTLHGNCQWTPIVLALAGLCWAWSNQPSLSQRWEQTRDLLARWMPGAFLPTTDHSFLKTLAGSTKRLTAALVALMRQRALATAPGGTLDGRQVVVVDGTKVGVPWTNDHDRKLGQGSLKSRKKRGGKPRRKRRAKRRSANSKAHDAVRPQILLTLFWHLASGLPWAWRMDPVGGSERAAALAMLAVLPAGALILGDAGFTGFDFWHGVLGSGRHFVLRIGANVTLLKNLGWRCRTKNGVAYLWPAKQQQRGTPPVIVRLVRVRTGRGEMWLATSLLCARLASDRQLADLYRQRWGIEGWFRSLKQTFGKRTMLSRTAKHAECELQWSILALGLVQAHGVEALAAAGAEAQALSESAALAAFRTTVLQRDFARPDLPRLRARLAAARLDDYCRTKPKAGRHAHRQRTYQPTGSPQLRSATPAERHRAREVQAALGLA